MRCPECNADFDRGQFHAEGCLAALPPATVVKTIVTTVTSYSRQLDASIIREAFGLPFDARVYFVVPGGGDWSHADIDIDAGHPVYVEWTRTKSVDK